MGPCFPKLLISNSCGLPDEAIVRHFHYPVTHTLLPPGVGSEEPKFLRTWGDRLKV